MKKFIKYKYERNEESIMLEKSNEFNLQLQKRRSVRDFSNENFDERIIINCIKSAGSAPSGANKQPWHFVVVKNPNLKKKIRIAAEKEETEFYNGKATNEWLKDLEQFETNEEKPFLEEAPYLIAIFEEKYFVDEEGKQHKNYYTKESVGIATGILITALH